MEEAGLAMEVPWQQGLLHGRVLSSGCDAGEWASNQSQRVAKQHEARRVVWQIFCYFIEALVHRLVIVLPNLVRRLVDQVCWCAVTFGDARQSVTEVSEGVDNSSIGPQLEATAHNSAKTYK